MELEYIGLCSVLLLVKVVMMDHQKAVLYSGASFSLEMNVCSANP